MKHDYTIGEDTCLACGYTRQQVEDGAGPQECPGHRLKAVESFAEIRAHRDRIKHEENAAAGLRMMPTSPVLWRGREHFVDLDTLRGIVKDAFAETIHGGDPADFPVNRGSGVAFVAWPVYEAADESAPAYGDPGVPALPPSYWNSGLELCPCGCGISKAEIERAKRDLKAAGIQVD